MIEHEPGDDRPGAVDGLLAPQRRALADAKAVLFVDDAEAQPAERYALLDQRVRADDDVDLQREPTLALARCARQ